MHVYVVYAHPSKQSFTCQVLRAFEEGLLEAGHTVEVGDVCAMDFQTDMDPAQYEREMGPDPDAPVPADVCAAHAKIARPDAVAFVYPVWWSDCPAKLKGWFDRVFAHGYSYRRGGWRGRTKPVSVRWAVALCSAGQTEEALERQGIAQSMRTIMLQDRMHGLGAKQSRMVIRPTPPS
jgi:NAD(P)H dehydrogenase (quinone)